MHAGVRIKKRRVDHGVRALARDGPGSQGAVRSVQLLIRLVDRILHCSLSGIRHPVRSALELPRHLVVDSENRSILRKEIALLRKPLEQPVTP